MACATVKPLMAKQLYERFPVKGYFTDLAELMSEARPDVVHITTPPESHFDIARFCLEHGCHVYVEKPFTLDAEQAQQLVDLATEKGLKLTVGHNYQFSHVARRMRALVESGYLGGPPVHMESYYGYDLGDPSYARALLGDKHHWVRRLPGKLLHNMISHGIARIAEFLTSDHPQVIAHGFVSPLLKGIRRNRNRGRASSHHLRGGANHGLFHFLLADEAFASTSFGSTVRRTVSFSTRITKSCSSFAATKFKSYADTFIPPVLFAKQHLGNLREET